MSSKKKVTTDDSKTGRTHRSSDKSSSIFSDSDGKRDLKKSDTQKTIDWTQVEEETEQDKLSEESLLTKILNCLMFCGLIMSTDIMWTFPQKVLYSGGVYFIIIYLFMLLLVAFPLLHMEIFIGQRCQSGIVRTLRMYGQGFECIGIGVFYLTLLRSLAGVQNSYLLFRHLINVLLDAEGIMSCGYEEYKGEIDSAHCVSLVDDLQCGDDFFYGNKCVSDISLIEELVSVADFYSMKMRTTTSDFDFKRLLYNFLIYGIIATIGIIGFQGVRVLLIVIYCLFIVAFIVMAFPFLSVGVDVSGIIFELSTFSTLESVFSVKTYITALGLCLVTTGVGLSGVLCASSFRPKKGNSFALTYVIVINNIILCLVSLLYSLCMINVTGFNYSETVSPTIQKLDFMLGSLTEFFVSQGHGFWLWLFFMAVALINLKSFCAALIMVYAFVRDHARRQRRRWDLNATMIFSVVCFVLCISRSFPGMDDSFYIFSDDLYYSTIYIVLASLVVVFIHLYGEREYLIDLCDVYEFKEREHLFVSATHPWQFVVFDFAPVTFLIIQIYLATHVLHPLRKNDFWSVVFKHVIVALISLVVLCFTIRVCYVYKQPHGFWTLFTINAEHPSFKRISSGWNSRKEKDRENRKSSPSNEISQRQ